MADLGRVIDITTTGNKLSIERGFLVVSTSSSGGESKRRIPLDDIETLVIHSAGTVLTSNVMSSLAILRVPVMFCDERHIPIATSLPTNANHEHTKRLKAQIEMDEETSAELWKQVIRSKINQQANVLELFEKRDGQLRRMVEKVLPGDPANVEAEAAKFYWRELFGPQFRRGSSDPINARLNYGYAILRATLARSVCAHGLSPSLGIHHRNLSNPMCLVDDLLEPFRPLVDAKVYSMYVSTGHPLGDLQPGDRRELVAVIAGQIMTDAGPASVESRIEVLVVSFYRSCVRNAQELDLEWRVAGGPR